MVSYKSQASNPLNNWLYISTSYISFITENKICTIYSDHDLSFTDKYQKFNIPRWSPKL